VSIWKSVWKQGLVAGSLGSAASTLALVAAGRREARSGFAPVNAVSHWYWGDRAFHRPKANLRHTAMGYLTHHGASVFWATAYAAATRGSETARSLPGIALGAAATSAIACFVDYRLTPKRLTPGFEHEISRPSMAGVYAAMAVGLAAGAWLSRGPAPGRKLRAPSPPRNGGAAMVEAGRQHPASSTPGGGDQAATGARDSSVPGVQL
jgi:hypothetical protein